jgi:hypothetical protein
MSLLHTAPTNTRVGGQIAFSTRVSAAPIPDSRPPLPEYCRYGSVGAKVWAPAEPNA